MDEQQVAHESRAKLGLVMAIGNLCTSPDKVRGQENQRLVVILVLESTLREVWPKHEVEGDMHRKVDQRAAQGVINARHRVELVLADMIFLLDGHNFLGLDLHSRLIQLQTRHLGLYLRCEAIDLHGWGLKCTKFDWEFQVS
jgi:hypothetical protein